MKPIADGPLPKVEVMGIFEAEESQHEISNLYDVSPALISKIKRGEHIYSKKLFAVTQQLRSDYPALSRQVIVHTILRAWRDYLSEEQLYAEASALIVDYMEDSTEA
jgi:hypothetical protein